MGVRELLGEGMTLRGSAEGRAGEQWIARAGIWRTPETKPLQQQAHVHAREGMTRSGLLMNGPAGEGRLVAMQPGPRNVSVNLCNL